MLSRTTEYAVRALIVLARHHNERAVSAGELARRAGAPRNYLSKTLQVLAKHGVLASTPGPGGGFTLAVPPESLTIAAVADLFPDARPRAGQCLLSDQPCDPAHPCVAHWRWTSITSDARKPLLRTTIGELCGNVAAGTPPPDHG